MLSFRKRGEKKKVRLCGGRKKGRSSILIFKKGGGGRKEREKKLSPDTYVGREGKRVVGERLRLGPGGKKKKFPLFYFLGRSLIPVTY